MRGRIYKVIADWLEQVRQWVEQSTEFNEMDRQMLIKALRQMQRQAEKQKQAKEYWQRVAQEKTKELEEGNGKIARQIIRLLDDLEEVAHGDLTIQSDTTDDVLGCIADVVNLIIENQREIVKQLPPDASIRKRFRLPE